MSLPTRSALPAADTDPDRLLRGDYEARRLELFGRSCYAATPGGSSLLAWRAKVERPSTMTGANSSMVEAPHVMWRETNFS